MTLISYAQNFEDVMLWRVLGHVQNGFYIDVGAAHPDEYSVTRTFYDRGWQGINIEPLPGYFRRLEAARARDLNLNIALAEKVGELPFLEIEGTGLSTLDKQVAEEHRAAGWTVHEAAVHVTTLADMCRKHVAGPVHFLKIDVEGAERAVLEGADFALCRPWIVLVEATRPLSDEQNHDQWESLLLAADYRFVWFDGLNRFYIASEQWDDLSPAFAVPPNVFDDFIRAGDTEHLNRIVDSESRAGQAEARAVEAEGRASRAETDRLGAAARASEAEARAAEAEARAADGEARVSHDQARVKRAEARATEAEARAHRLETDTAHLKARAAEAEARAAQAEQKAAQASAAHAIVVQEMAALRTSTSWVITAPVRMLKLALRGNIGLALNEIGMPLSRIERLKRVGGSDGSRAKRASRIAIYGVARCTARAPAGRATTRLVRKALPGPYRWLYTRYLIYRNAGTSIVAANGDPLAPPGSLHLQASARLEQNGLSAEEQIMLLRLRAREDAA